MSGDLRYLKSGTDIRGVAVATEDAPATLTEEIGRRVGVAFARWLADKQGKPVDALRIAVGRDSRVSGPALQAAMMDGLLCEGAAVLDCGLATTPAMFMSTILKDCDGAVMVTASHLPWQRNGYKFFTPQGGLDGGDISALLGSAAQADDQKGEQQAEPSDLMQAYTKHLAELVIAALQADQPLDGLHIVVDAGNGAGGFYADFLRSLGADTQGSQFLDPDGRFPNHIPNPEAPEAMRSLSDAVCRAGADLGVLFDADCDRAAMVDAQGNEINRNRLIALVTAMLLAEKQGITVVTDSVVSSGLDAFIRAKGGVLHRFKRGYRNVIDEAVRLGGEGIDCPLAMETSGHAALRENHFLDDGMYLVTRLIIQAKRMGLAGGTLTDLIAGLREPIESVEVRLPILAEDFRATGAQIIDHITQAVASNPGQALDPENREGVRILFGTPDEWVQLRLSVHDPLLVINAESGKAGGTGQMLSAVEGMLAGLNLVDLTALRVQINTSSSKGELS